MCSAVAAVFFSDTELYVLSRKVFTLLAENHKKFALNLTEGGRGQHARPPTAL